MFKDASITFCLFPLRRSLHLERFWEVGGRSGLHQVDLGAGHIFCQREGGAVPRCHPGLTIVDTFCISIHFDHWWRKVFPSNTFRCSLAETRPSFYRGFSFKERLFLAIAPLYKEIITTKIPGVLLSTFQGPIILLRNLSMFLCWKFMFSGKPVSANYPPGRNT